MQAVILAAGKSSRFYPFTNYSHKSLVSLCGKPVIVHTLLSLHNGGIDNVVIVQNSTKDVEKTIGDGLAYGLKISYVQQDEPLGMGDALLGAEEKLDEEFFLLNAHHVDFDHFAVTLQNGKTAVENIVLLAKKETAAGKYASVTVSDDGTLHSIEEKPQEASNLRLIGMYLLHKSFLSVLKSVPKEHYNFEKALETYCGKHTANVVITEDDSVTLKYVWDLLSISAFLLAHRDPRVSENATVDSSAEITGDVIVEDGARILDGAKIKGPAYIGENVTIGTNALIRNGAVIEENCVIGANMEVKNSIILSETTTHSGFIGDSVIGRHCKLAAGFITANARLDRTSVAVNLGEKKVDTGRNHFGVLVGDEVKFGIRVSTMPGVTIGNNAVIGPGTTVLKNVSENTRYFTEVAEVKEEQAKRKKFVLFDIDHTLFDTQKLKDTNLQEYGLYEEVENVLSEIAKIAEIGVLSEGRDEFQKAKLLKTNIHDRFAQEHIHIVEKKQEMFADVLEKYKGYELFVVDDWLSLLHQMKLIYPSVFTIWVKRGIYATNAEPIEGFTPDATVDNLSTLHEIISKA